MEESCGTHSEDDKTLPEKNKKRVVKTHAQIEALETFYIEHKYPSEVMKMQLAGSIGLTEKQVSGWFCHRRLKDKKLQNGEACLIEKQDRSSGVIQDRGSGLRQDSCGSTKQEDDRNLDPREVESGRLNSLQEISTADLTCQPGRHYIGDYNRIDDETSGSSSSLWNMSSYHNGDPSDVATSTRQIPKFQVETNGGKPRCRPSGYLKLKGQVENSAVTAVKRQLGRNYRQDGPPVGIDFDPLPPGAFESPTQDPVDETYYSGEHNLYISPDDSNVCQYPKFHKECKYNSTVASYNSNLYGTRVIHGFGSPVNLVRQKFGQRNFSADKAEHYPGSRFSVEFAENSSKDIPDSESRDNYLMKSKHGVEGGKMSSFLKNHRFLPYDGNMVERAESYGRSNDVGPKISPRKNTWKVSSYRSNKWNEYHNLRNKGSSQQIIENDNFYGERRMMDENYEPDQVNIALKTDMPAPKRTRDEFHHQQYYQRSLVVDNEPRTSQIIRFGAEKPSPSTQDDKDSAETSSSVD